MSFLFFPTFANRLAKEVTLAYQSNAVSTSNGSSKTFSSQSIGTAGAGRIIVVGATLEGYNIDWSSCTIGGVSATEIADSFSQVGTDGYRSALFAATLATGTTADIVVSATASSSNHAIGVWSMFDASISPHDTMTSTAVPGTGSITIPSGGCCIAITHQRNSSASCTWTNLTENFDQNIETIHHYSGASTSTAGSPTVTATWSSAAIQSLSCASFAAG